MCLLPLIYHVFFLLLSHYLDFPVITLSFSLLQHVRPESYQNINVYENPQMSVSHPHMVLVYLYPQAKPFHLHYFGCNNIRKALMYG